MNFSEVPEVKENKLLTKKRILLFLLGLFVILVLLAGVLAAQYIHSALYEPVSSSNETVKFTITKGEGTRNIAEELEKQHLIKSSLVFIGYLKYSNRKISVQVGDYAIHRNSTMIQIIDKFAKGDVITTKITIPEGWTDQQIEDYLVKKGITTQADFKSALKKDYGFDFLKKSPDGSLQGFLYPDTYILSSKPTAEEAIFKMLAEFQKKADPEIRAKMGAEQLSYYQVLTLSSIVEREVQTKADKKAVAGIFLNRLSIDMNLDSCATVQYVLGTNKKILSDQDIAVDSPYNTYLNKGLPPGPIANPGMDSIEAVLNPAKTDYFYFFTGKDGKTYFSKTAEEHEAKKAKYL